MMLIGIYSEASAKKYGVSVYRKGAAEVQVTVIFNPDKTPKFFDRYREKWPDAKLVGAVDRWMRRIGPIRDRRLPLRPQKTLWEQP